MMTIKVVMIMMNYDGDGDNDGDDDELWRRWWWWWWWIRMAMVMTMVMVVMVMIMIAYVFHEDTTKKKTPAVHILPERTVVWCRMTVLSPSILFAPSTILAVLIDGRLKLRGDLGLNRCRLHRGGLRRRDVHGHGNTGPLGEAESNLRLVAVHLVPSPNLLVQLLHLLSLVLSLLLSSHGFLLGGVVAQDPVDGADTWHIGLVANVVRQQVVADLPRENTRIFVLVLQDFRHNFRSRDLRLAAANRPRPNWARLVISPEYFTDAAVRHEQLPRDFRRPNAAVRELNDAVSHVIGKRSAIHENASKLVYAARTYKHICEIIQWNP